MRGKFPSTLPAPARERPSRLAARARAAAMDTADQRSAVAEVQAARNEAGTARARQRASWRTKVGASELHRPPTSMPRTVSGATCVVSTATCAPFPKRRPLVTSIRGACTRPSSTFKSRSWTVAAASRQTRAAALLEGPPRESSTPEHGHAATWSPRPAAASCRCKGHAAYAAAATAAPKRGAMAGRARVRWAKP